MADVCDLFEEIRIPHTTVTLMNFVIMWLTPVTWLLLGVTHVFAVATQTPPLTIQCLSNGSIYITQKKTYDAEIFVVGNFPSCSDAVRHFRLDSGNHLLNTSCKGTTGYVLEVLNFTQTTHRPGFTSTVYNVNCTSNVTGNASVFTLVNTTNVSFLEEVVLPKLNVAILPANTTLNSSMTSASLSSMYLGQEVMLTIYNDVPQGRASYMLVPTLCEAYPTANSSVRLTLLHCDQNRCTKEDGVIGQFTTETINDVDVAWAPMYGFIFAGHPDSDLVIDCSVLVCPDISHGHPGRFVTNNGCKKTTSNSRRRKRRVGMSRDIIHAKTGTARTRVKLKNSLAKSEAVTTLASLLLPVAVMMTML
ncbi:uncharacterized protein LOC124121025 isoform X2 [Haliotis rufescens]|uniref:uncharacterized protein LOC124121025 isoform X2 n=1 Tax=Haliotis rufescens TaxID=6454 RepID=UPI00201E9D0B|nr:uncharacterized protein LOC124121025 isoform X2 [Haliotis rufescens]